MDDNGHRENGRQKHDMYKAAQSQWLLQHQPSMKQIMSIMAERDAAIQERNMALNEKNKAVEERDLAILQRDTAFRERNEAIVERDNALGALHYQHNAVNTNNTSCPPGCQVAQGMKHMHHHIVAESSYNAEQISLPEAPSMTSVGPENPKTQKAKQPRETKASPPNKKSSRPSKKPKVEMDGVNKHESTETQEIVGGDENQEKPDWLNQVAFDELSMPPPVCSCTGVYRQCYKWGNGGWQSACCTTTMSMYPLPPVPNKRHARVGGRKMSGSAFSKLLNRLTAEGHDPSAAVDLKEHWAKHGTNRYITIR